MRPNYKNLIKSIYSDWWAFIFTNSLKVLELKKIFIMVIFDIFPYKNVLGPETTKITAKKSL